MSSFDDDTDYSDRFYRGNRPFPLTARQEQMRAEAEVAFLAKLPLTPLQQALRERDEARTGLEVTSAALRRLETRVEVLEAALVALPPATPSEAGAPSDPTRTPPPARDR